MPSGYERLQPQPVHVTAQLLHGRIAERLPERHLVRVAAELVELVEDVQGGSQQIRGRLRLARLTSRVLVALVVVVAVLAFVLAVRQDLEGDVAWLELGETAINDLVFVAIAVFFLHSIPNRLERGHTLELLHRLRSLAHIIDMHQLTKDPERLLDSYVPLSRTVDVGLSRSEMERYLDYCSELLSLVAKAAALCAEESQDPVVLDTVNSIETLTNGMSRKIWQKISVLTRT